MLRLSTGRTTTTTPTTTTTADKKELISRPLTSHISTTSTRGLQLVLFFFRWPRLLSRVLRFSSGLLSAHFCVWCSRRSQPSSSLVQAIFDFFFLCSCWQVPSLVAHGSPRNDGSGRLPDVVPRVFSSTGLLRSLRMLLTIKIFFHKMLLQMLDGCRSPG